MKKLQILAVAMLFAMTGMNLVDAKEKPCPAGQKRRDSGKDAPCIKISRVTVDKKVTKAISKAVNSTPMAPATAANNAINAYNTAVNATTQNPTKVAATQTAAITGINNLIAIYQGYLATVTAGTSPVVYTSMVPVAASTLICDDNSIPSGTPAMCTDGTSPYSASAQTSGSTSSGTSTAAQSTCDDGSTAACDDNTVISTLICNDGTSPDINGMCDDGTLVTCADSTSPACGDGTSPMAPAV